MCVIKPMQCGQVELDRTEGLGGECAERTWLRSVPSSGQDPSSASKRVEHCFL